MYSHTSRLPPLRASPLSLSPPTLLPRSLRLLLLLLFPSSPGPRCVLRRHNREGVILSWAILGQKGKHHVNQHSNQYMKELLWPLGYDHDPDTELMFRRTAHLKWFKRSLMVFRKTPRPNKRRR